MKRSVDAMVPFGLRAQDPTSPPQPPTPTPPWSPSHHRLLDIGSSGSFVGMDISTPSSGPSSSSSSRLIHHSLMSDFSTQSSSSSSSFGYSQKNFHISDGTLYSILSPFQSRRSTSRPSFLRGHATITSTTPSPKGAGGSSSSSFRKSKLKFHNQEVPPSYRDRARKPPLPTNAAGCMPPLRTSSHFEVLDNDRVLFDDRPSPPVSLSASSSSVPGAGGCPLASCSSTSSNSSWFESVFREEGATGAPSSSTARKHNYDDDEVVVLDCDSSAMDLSSTSSSGHRAARRSFYSRQSSSESESYSLSSMRSFKRDLFTAATSGSSKYPEAEEEEEDDDDDDDEDDDDDTPLNLCLADLRRARPSVSETLSPNIKREMYFDDEEDTSDDDSDDDDVSFSGGQVPQNTNSSRRFSVPDLLLSSDSFLDVGGRLHSPSMDSSVSESSRTLDDTRPQSTATARAKRHHHTCPPTPPQLDSTREVPLRSYSQGSVPAEDDDDDDGKPCVKSPRISEMLQNMTLADCRTHLERYAAIRQRLMATHPEMFSTQCASSSLLDDLDPGKATAVANNSYWSDVPMMAPTAVDFEKRALVPIATTRSAESIVSGSPTVICPVSVVSTMSPSSAAASAAATAAATTTTTKVTDQPLPFLRTRHRVVSPGAAGKSAAAGGKCHPVRPRRPPPSPTLSERSSRSPYTNNDISICKFKLIKGSQPVLEEKKSLFVPVPRSSSDRGVYPGGGRVNEGASTSTSTSNSSSSSLLHQAPSTSGCSPQAAGASGCSPDSFRTYKIHVGSQEDMGRKLAATGGSKRLRRRSRKALVREKLEATFREQGFLIKTQQVSSAEGAVYCKFRQLRKFTRYLYKSWRDYLPKDLDELNEPSGLARNQSF